jgi:hypothetical protein
VKERLLGVVLLIAGAASFHWGVVETLKAANRHDANVMFSPESAALCPLALGMGTAYLILGKQATEIFGTRTHPTEWAYLFGGILAVIGVGLYFWLKSVLHAQGYR